MRVDLPTTFGRQVDSHTAAWRTRKSNDVLRLPVAAKCTYGRRAAAAARTLAANAGLILVAQARAQSRNFTMCGSR